MNVTSGTTLPAFVAESVSVEKMKTMALLLRDPNRIHWDEKAVSELGMGDRPINQGPTNMAYVINMLINWLGDPSLIRSIEVRFLDNVFAGERAQAGGVVTNVRAAGSETVAECDVWLEADGRRVLQGTATVLVTTS